MMSRDIPCEPTNTLTKANDSRQSDDCFDFPKSTRQRGRPVLIKSKSEPVKTKSDPSNIESPSYGWQATHRKSPPKFSRSSSVSSTGSRGDPTLPLNKGDNVALPPVPSLDTIAVEEEHLERQKQSMLKKAVKGRFSGKKHDPVYQDSPFSPPSGRTVQSDVNVPFCYATGLEPVQEFLGNLSINSESSYLSSYNSLDDKARILA